MVVDKYWYTMYLYPKSSSGFCLIFQCRKLSGPQVSSDTLPVQGLLSFSVPFGRGELILCHNHESLYPYFFNMV